MSLNSQLFSPISEYAVRTMEFREALDDTLLGGATVATSILVVTLPIYYVWKVVVSLRRKAIPFWLPTVCLSLWLLQWPFFILSAAGCMGGGCADPVRNWLEVIGTLLYNLVPAYWLWRRSGVRVA